jgi:ABC-type dipeptide/oligopeptide/nickel transport system permease subunit
MKQRKPPFNNVRARRAIADYGIKRKEIAQTVFQGLAKPLVSMIEVAHEVQRLLAGFYGGRTDQVLMHLLAFPIFLLAIVIMVILKLSTMNVVLALAIVRVPILARIARASVLSMKENEYIEAVKALALSQVRVLGRHVLPNCLAPIIVTATLEIGNAIIIEASLSFLGLGTQPPTPPGAGI